VTFFIGVDGGGTRTRAVVIDAEGSELGRSSAVGAVATASAPGRAASAVTEAVRGAAAQAGVELPGAVLWAGLAGAGSAGARNAVRDLLRGAALADRVVVGTDVEAAFHDAFPTEPGVLLIAGTGSIAWARSAAGKVDRVGGWGRSLGDEGSGFMLGLEGLRLVVRAADGRAPKTSLTEALLAACDVERVSDLVPWIEHAGKGEVAALAPAVVEAADGGDPGAEALVESAVDELATLVRVAAGARRLPVVLWGGLIAERGPLRGRLLSVLRAEGYECLERSVDPALGAARMALEGRAPDRS
jgi:N-acetylglucosamine kinase-like BadF-type ATPase